MPELIAVAIVCATVLVGLMLVLRYFKTYRTERQEWLDQITKNVVGMVEERLAKPTQFQKDVETLHANQVRLAQEVELVKKTTQIRTNLQRPPGSIV